MAEAAEENFPRGGNVAVGGVKRKHGKKSERDLFKTSQETGPTKAKRQKQGKEFTKNGKKTKAKKDGRDQILTSSANHVSILTYERMTIGLQVLGCVKEVTRFYLSLSLSNGIEGRVPITAISDAYTQLLQRLTEGDTECADEVSSLDELFRPGMPLRCLVTQVKRNMKGKHEVMLSINPRDVNKHFQPSSLKSGMVLTGCVSSCEDHGYILDIGVAGVAAFLPTTEASCYIEDYNNGESLKIGSYLHCMIETKDHLEMKAGQSRTVQITVNPRQVFNSVVTGAMGINMQSLLPGMKVNTKIIKAFDHGVVVKFLSYKGSIQKMHLLQRPRDLTADEQLEACVLYIEPTSKMIGLSCRPHLVTPHLAPRNLFGNLEVGQILREAQVVHADKKHGLVLRVAPKTFARSPVTQLSDRAISDVPKEFPKGSIQSCRIYDFDYADKLLLVTLKKTLLEQQFLKYSDIKPGILIKAEVLALRERGVLVKVSTNIKGFIPLKHLADVPLKKPEKHFTEGKEIQCRVLKVDLVEKKLKLTAKKSLLTTTLPILTDKTQAFPGMVVEGVILIINDKGVVVSFYNGVTGFVRKGELSTEFIEYPEKVFFIGQVVRARVLHLNSETGNLFLSFKIQGNIPFGAKHKKLPSGCKIGTLVSVKVVGKNDKGLDVQLLPTEMNAFLPKMHLSDHVSSVGLLLEMYKEGDIIEDCIYFSVTSIIQVTKKPSLVAASRDGTLIKEFGTLQAGMIRPGVVRRVMDYGVFVDMLGGLGSGLVPTKYLCDERVPNPSSLFTEGQSVYAKVTIVEEEKKRSLLSLRLKDCYQGETSVGVDILEENLDEIETVRTAFRAGKGVKQSLASLQVGEVTRVTITKVTEEGVLCELPGGLRGVVTIDHMRGIKESTCQVGVEIEALILYIDLETSCVELSLNPKLVKSVKNRLDNKFSQAREGQDIKSEVLLIKDSHVLVALKGHSVGQLAYLPAQLHLNDMLEKRLYEVTQLNRVIIHKVQEGRILATLKMHETRMDASKKGDQFFKHTVQHNLKFGQICNAVVRAIHPFHMNVSIGEARGHIHISQIVDDFEEGTNPLKSFAVDQHIKAKVIKFRDVKTHRDLPANHSTISKSIPVLSLKPSCLQSNDQAFVDPTYKIGDTVQAFVHSYNSHCLMMCISGSLRGKVHRLNISDDKEVLEHVTEHFKEGHGYLATVCGHRVGDIIQLSLRGQLSPLEDGCVTMGHIKDVTLTQLSIRLAGGYEGQVDVTDVRDDYIDRPTLSFEEDQFVECAVISCRNKNNCVLSLRLSRLHVLKAGKIHDPEIFIGDLKPGTTVRGYVINISKSGIFVQLGQNLKGCVRFCHMSKHNTAKPHDVVFKGKVVKVSVISTDVQKKKIWLSMLEKHTGEPEDIPEEFFKQEQKKRKRKVESCEETAEIAGTDSKRKKFAKEEKPKEDQVSEDSHVTDSKASMTSGPRLSVTGGFKWDNSFSMPSASDMKEDLNSDSEDSDDESGQAKPGTHRTRQEKLAALREEERQLFKKEENLMDTSRQFETVDDFDRLVLQSPNSSLVWLRYMAFHLETAEIEKARAVAERALKTISFREEQEKLNVWVAYLNLENMYGSHTSLTAVFERALQQNDAIKVYNQLLNIYDKAGKEEAAEQLHTTVVRRFSTNKDVWINFGLFYFKHGKSDMARKIMQRSLKSLHQGHHVEVLSKFAQMEFKYGESERGKTMFENILSTYPRRTDLWSVYLDMMVKLGDMDQVRKLFERVIHMEMPAKKMKFFFKKYLDFEEKHGTEQTANTVKEKAIAYVEVRAAVVNSEAGKTTLQSPHH